jgi:hypothetical protein
MKNIDEVLIKNVNYTPNAERKMIVEKIIKSLDDSINWTNVVKVFKYIIENNGNSSICQSVFCVSYIRKLISSKENE